MGAGTEEWENNGEGARDGSGQRGGPGQGVRDSGSRSNLCGPVWISAWFRRAPRPPGRARAAGIGRGCPVRCLRARRGADALSPLRQLRGRPRGVEGPLGAGAAVMAAGQRALFLPVPALLPVLALLPLAAAVYEDQVGKFDW